ncbi:unnamed protein product [Adineta steineri]|uniref:SAP domain-containing protein n=1 Tax=Adineta steineri TaxID=433720 RepID=A0A818HF78_9BILA|nr:unnamed protein product [Adineta steineri]CAF1229690.1 unnamed protein product [Adineta steineri]CAF3505294.1 unnamed protein product [Adineta steineri]CAF3715287.1 unnamed protein product [Adineta steineri]
MSLKRNHNEEDLPYDPDDDDNDDSDDEHVPLSKKQKKSKPPSLRVQLNVLTIPILKNILRSNHQNPFGNKGELISRIIYLVRNGGYPSCPECKSGRLKIRLHRRKNQSKFYCPGFPTGFREGDSFYQCDYVTDTCNKQTFILPSNLNLII